MSALTLYQAEVALRGSQTGAERGRETLAMKGSNFLLTLFELICVSVTFCSKMKLTEHLENHTWEL